MKHASKFREAKYCAPNPATDQLASKKTGKPSRKPTTKPSNETCLNEVWELLTGWKDCCDCSNHDDDDGGLTDLLSPMFINCPSISSFDDFKSASLSLHIRTASEEALLGIKGSIPGGILQTPPAIEAVPKVNSAGTSALEANIDREQTQSRTFGASRVIIDRTKNGYDGRRDPSPSSESRNDCPISERGEICGSPPELVATNPGISHIQEGAVQEHGSRCNLSHDRTDHGAKYCASVPMGVEGTSGRSNEANDTTAIHGEAETGARREGADTRVADDLEADLERGGMTALGTHTLGGEANGNCAFTSSGVRHTGSDEASSTTGDSATSHSIRNGAGRSAAHPSRPAIHSNGPPLSISSISPICKVQERPKKADTQGLRGRSSLTGRRLGVCSRDIECMKSKSAPSVRQLGRVQTGRPVSSSIYSVQADVACRTKQYRVTSGEYKATLRHTPIDVSLSKGREWEELCMRVSVGDLLSSTPRLQQFIETTDSKLSFIQALFDDKEGRSSGDGNTTRLEAGGVDDQPTGLPSLTPTDQMVNLGASRNNDISHQGTAAGPKQGAGQNLDCSTHQGTAGPELGVGHNLDCSTQQVKGPPGFRQHSYSTPLQRALENAHKKIYKEHSHLFPTHHIQSKADSPQECHFRAARSAPLSNTKSSFTWEEHTDDHSMKKQRSVSVATRPPLTVHPCDRSHPITVRYQTTQLHAPSANRIRLAKQLQMDAKANSGLAGIQTASRSIATSRFSQR